jgi:choline kinase
VHTIVSSDVRSRAAVTEQLSHRLAVNVVCCPDSKLGNGRSAAFAQQLVTDERFYLLMSDHLVSAEHLRLAEAAPAERCALATCAPAPWIDLHDATKVSSNEAGAIVAIGKDLVDYNEIDTGVFAMTSALFPALEEASLAGEHSLTAGNRVLARKGLLVSAPVGDLRWCDIDTPADMAAAEAWVTGVRTRSGRPLR